MSRDVSHLAGRTLTEPRKRADAAPPWHHNPSAWSQRLPICALATFTAGIAFYMAAYQWRWVPTIWDPVFGDQTARVLDSDLSEQMRYWMLIPDAALGAIGYLSEAILGLAGSTRRWRNQPWLVILFGIDVIPLGIVSAILVVMQGTVVGSWCFLCLITAVVSLLLVALAYDEVWSSVTYLREVHRRTGSRRAVGDAFWGRTVEQREDEAEIVGAQRSSSLGHWPRMAEMALAVWLAAGVLLLPGPHATNFTVVGLIAAAAIFAASALSLLPRFNQLHLFNLGLSAALIGFLFLTSPSPAPAAVQHLLLTSLVLANFALIPVNLPQRTPAEFDLSDG